MNEKSLRYRKTRLEKESSVFGYEFYFISNFEKPFIKINNEVKQFRSRKAAADYAQAIYYLRKYADDADALGILEHYNKMKIDAEKKII